MTGISVKQIENMSESDKENMALDYIQGINQDDSDKCISVAWVFFLNYYNSIDAFSMLKPEEYKRNIESHIAKNESLVKHSRHAGRAKLNDNTIDKCYKLWTRTKFFTVENISKGPRRKKNRSKAKGRSISVYRFNLEPFFRYAEERGFNFTQEQKKILDLIFSPDKVRESIYNEYYSINFLEAMIKYYVRFYIQFLRDNKKSRKEHYFDKEFLDYIIFSKLKEFRSHKEFTVTKASKFDKVLDRNHTKYQYYLSPDKPMIYNLQPKGRRKNKDLDFDFKGNYYSVYHSLHHFYEDLMNELDEKILGVLLHGVPKKIS